MTAQQAETKPAQPIEVPEGYRMDAKKRLVPEETIKEIDLARNDFVLEWFGKAKALQQQLQDFKLAALGDIGAFIDLSAERYDVQVGGVKAISRWLASTAQSKSSVPLPTRSRLMKGYKLPRLWLITALLVGRKVAETKSRCWLMMLSMLIKKARSALAECWACVVITLMTLSGRRLCKRLLILSR